MSQHIHGEVGQTISQDLGEFIFVGPARVRKDTIVAYHYSQFTDEEPNSKWGVALHTTHGRIGAPTGPDRESADKVIEQLDWIFAKDKFKEGKL